MYVVVLAGGIASGKSTVARALASRGARVADLDVLSREATNAGSPVNEQIACEFGADVLDTCGNLRRAVLARRAFATPEATQALERITHPAIRARLEAWLDAQGADALCVVEVPLLDRMEDLASLADEVLCVTCPLALRRERAIGRGMQADDFDARVARQTSDHYLVAHATTVLVNDKGEHELAQRIDDWWQQRARLHREFRAAAAKNSQGAE